MTPSTKGGDKSNTEKTGGLAKKGRGFIEEGLRFIETCAVSEKNDAPPRKRKVTKAAQ